MIDIKKFYNNNFIKFLIILFCSLIFSIFNVYSVFSILFILNIIYFISLFYLSFKILKNL